VRATSPGRGERGETLVELLVTVVVLGTCIVSLLLGVATAVSSSDTHRQDSTGEGVLRSFAERLTDPRDVPYQNCAGVGTYPIAPAGFSAPSGWTISITGVSYLQTDNSYSGSCPGTDLGAQQLTLQAVSPHVKNGATVTVAVVKRKP
jgi:Tfp pilus assembly protein PilV